MKLIFHSKPIRKHTKGRFTKGVTPYHLTGHNGGWRIGFGASSFLVAEGSGFSRQHGKNFFRMLEDDWLLRQKSKRPIRR